ncbi:MAG: DUF1211 domain-containing protein [Candidatus Dormibacteraeota bacterium]|nr:DUF1211 domain-containing protein [Candidatus Dormibacteraeota bacterium]
MTSRQRTEAFSDGIFAVAATLLVLDLKVPQIAGDLGGALLKQWPAYAAYAVSFLTIGIIWVNHHRIFDRLRSVDRPLQFLNLLLLMTVAAIPFGTSLLSAYLQRPTGHEDRIAAAAYGAIMTLMGVGFAAINFYIARSRHLLHDPTRWSRAGQIRFLAPGVPLYSAAILLSLLDARLALVVYGLLAVFYAFLPILERE